MSQYATERYTFEIWPISALLQRLKNKQLNLQPHYQRNDVWSTKSQRELIDTIGKGMPLPTFFVRRKDGNYEMVDGQQRSRAVVSFCAGDISDLNSIHFKDLTREQREFFCDYKLHVVLLAGFSDKEIEDFYVLVNSSGVRLNRPELKKAEYYSTLFLKLCEELSAAPEFESLDLFSEKSAERMNDIDFVSELIVILLCGITDKKEKVDQLFDSDISKSQYESLKIEALRVFKCIGKLNKSTPLAMTRLKQKGDFYTLFQFIHSHKGLDDEMLSYMYSFIIKAMPHIRPSQEQCETFKDYALACVSQANSKDARLKRASIFDKLFFNTTGVPNDYQKDVAKYFSALEEREMKFKNIGPCVVIDLSVR